MSTAQAIPGTAVPTGAQVSPGGSIGPTGVNAYTNLASSFTVPAYGSTVVVTVYNATWMVVGEMLWVDQSAGGPGQAGLMQVTNINGNQVTLLNISPQAGIPLADNTQSGLMRQVSGNTTDFVDGTNHCQPIVTGIGLASNTKSGLMLQVSGNTTDFVDGTNHCQPLTAIPLATNTRAGLLTQLSGNTADYVDGTNHCRNISTGVGALGRYYGSDTVNSGAYVVTVAADFTLTAGVVVWVTVLNICGNNPTLNVNSTGAQPVVNKANVALSANEIRPGTFGVVYDGTSWRVITPVQRWYYATNPANPTIECAGYDSVFMSATFSSATGAGITLAHIGYGVPVVIDILNTTGAAMSYFINGTSASGAAPKTYWCNQTSMSVGAVTCFDSSTIQSLTNGNRLYLVGGCAEGYLFFR